MSQCSSLPPRKRPRHVQSAIRTWFWPWLPPIRLRTNWAGTLNLCAKCNQTTSYILPTDPAAESADPQESAEAASNRRRDARETLNAPSTIYHKDGTFLLPCTVRDISRSGGPLQLFQGNTAS